MRSLKDFQTRDPSEISRCLYVTYRIFWENSSDKTIMQELKHFPNTFLKKLRSFSWEKALEVKNEREKFSICNAVPSFTVDRLLEYMDLEILEKNIEFMNGLSKDIKLSIRINRLLGKFTEEELTLRIEENFRDNNIIFNADSHLPDLLNIPLKSKNKVINTSLYKQGHIIFQDKASATVVHALSPQKEEIIYDMCAAPGIKTSLIAQKMENTGLIIAGEFLNERIKSTKHILKRLNVVNCFLINSDSIDPPLRYENYFDRILLDPPCTGSGTFLSNPELKWRQSEKFLNQNIILQKKLLRSAIKFLKPNGILVYSTCSLYPEEGELQILEVLDHLYPLDLPKWFSLSYTINDSIIPGTGRLFPSTHQTQGFFIGKFKKKEK